MEPESLHPESKLGMNRISTLKNIVKNHQAEKIDGVLIDVLIADYILRCWEAGNDNTKEQIATQNIASIGKIALRICTGNHDNVGEK